MEKIKISPKAYLNQRFQIAESFQRFDQKNDIFNRSIWDDQVNPKSFYVSYDITNYKPKKSEGFDHWDYALRNASWHLTDFIGERNSGTVEGFTDFYQLHTKGPKEKIILTSREDTTARIKKAALTFGAKMVGICEVDERWLYAKKFQRETQHSQDLNLPAHLKYAIVLIHPMDYELTQTIPSAIGGTSTGTGYTESLAGANTLAQFITNLGYEAVASLNDTALSVPMAIQAGLGEYGRNGLLITPKYGPRVRISKVFTDLPLNVDQPIEFGVQKMCNLCRKCADNCPVKAIPHGLPQAEPPNFSSHAGLIKWTVNAEKCFKFWVNMNTDCAICIRVCPYNKDYSKWWHRLGIRLTNTPLRRLLLWLDQKWKFGERIKPKSWWNK